MKKRITIVGIIAVLIAGYVGFALMQPLAALSPTVAQNSLSITTPAIDLPWPAYGQGALALSDGAVVSIHGDQAPVATASTAKLITSLVVLAKRPLQPGQQGQTITFTDADVAMYKQYIANHGSVAPVFAGMQLTEYQVLEAVLLPSANNMADSLAIWAYGSLAAYKTAATSYLQAHGLTHTVIGSDASGLSPDTTSTASDLAKIGALAMQNPVVAQIVGQKSAQLPDLGTISNYNSLLGQNNVVGIKTGNNDQDPGAFVGAATVTMGGKVTTLITVLAGGPSLSQVLSDSNTLLVAAQKSVTETTVVEQGTILGDYVTPDGSHLQAVAAENLRTTLIRGAEAQVKVELQPIPYTAKAGQKVGTATVMENDFAPSAQVPIILKAAPQEPHWTYRLLHP